MPNVIMQARQLPPDLDAPPTLLRQRPQLVQQAHAKKRIELHTRPQPIVLGAQLMHRQERSPRQQAHASVLHERQVVRQWPVALLRHRLIEHDLQRRVLIPRERQIRQVVLVQVDSDRRRQIALLIVILACQFTRSSKVGNY